MDKYSIVLVEFKKIKIHQKYNLASLDGYLTFERPNIKFK